MTWLSYLILGLALITIALIVSWPKLRYRFVRSHMNPRLRRLRRSE